MQKEISAQEKRDDAGKIRKVGSRKFDVGSNLDMQRVQAQARSDASNYNNANNYSGDPMMLEGAHAKTTPRGITEAQAGLPG